MAPARTAPNITIDAVAPSSISVGQPLIYELVIRNVGTSSVANVRIEETLPARAAFVGSEPAAESSGGRLAWSIGTMEPGIEKRIKVTVRPGDEGEISSRAVVSFSSEVEARVKVTRPKITLAMTAPDAARVGERIPIQIRLTNSGSGTASRVLLQARFSDGLSHSQGQMIEAEIANLAAGETRTLTLEAVGTRSGPQQCFLSAVADASPPESAKAGVTLVEPMLVVKQGGPVRCLVKGEPTYSLELSNPGTAATDPIQVWAALPAGFEFVSATDGGGFTEANRSVGWKLPGLPAGATKSVSMKLRAVAPSEGVIRSVAVAQAEPVQPAGGVGNEARLPGKPLESRVETVVKAEGVPALRFEVFDLEDPVVAGREAVYEIRIVNQGTGVCTNIQLMAELGEGTSVVGPATGPTASRASGQQITFEPISQLAVKAEVVYRVRVKGIQPGDHRFRVRLSCSEMRTAVVKEENTRFYKE
jgi:uncharacterized repeat protein (TIGR01451 family)